MTVIQSISPIFKKLLMVARQIHFIVYGLGSTASMQAWTTFDLLIPAGNKMGKFIIGLYLQRKSHDNDCCCGDTLLLSASESEMNHPDQHRVRKPWTLVSRPAVPGREKNKRSAHQLGHHFTGYIQVTKKQDEVPVFMVAQNPNTQEKKFHGVIDCLLWCLPWTGFWVLFCFWCQICIVEPEFYQESLLLNIWAGS